MLNVLTIKPRTAELNLSMCRFDQYEIVELSAAVYRQMNTTTVHN